MAKFKGFKPSPKEVEKEEKTNGLTPKTRTMLEKKLRELPDSSGVALAITGDQETIEEAMRLWFYDKRIDLLKKRKKITFASFQKSELTAIDVTDVRPSSADIVILQSPKGKFTIR